MCRVLVAFNKFLWLFIVISCCQLIIVTIMILRCIRHLRHPTTQHALHCDQLRSQASHGAKLQHGSRRCSWCGSAWVGWTSSWWQATKRSQKRNETIKQENHRQHFPVQCQDDWNPFMAIKTGWEQEWIETWIINNIFCIKFEDHMGSNGMFCLNV